MSSPEPPKYTKYRARPSLFRRGSKAPERVGPDGPADAPGRLPGSADAPPSAPLGDAGPGRRVRLGGRRRITVRRVLVWLVAAVGAWLALSLVLFLVSAQIEQGRLSDATEQALDGGGLPLASPTTILVLGSDQRAEGTREPGASTSGPSRSDSIMLMHVGGGKNSRLSIARDTIVDIPGHGREKINHAYAYGGAPLAIETVKRYLGIEINHVVEVSFSEFPELIDAMGGITYKGSCVVARINGGARNGGVTVRIPAGKKTHLDGRKALALARARKNDCNPRENDLSRARRQQRIVSAMRSRILSPAGFIRLPFIAWEAPRAIRTDMSGPTLLAVFASMTVGGTPETRVLGTPDGNVPEERRQRAVAAFLRG